MTSFEELQKEIDEFEKIPVNETTSDERKERVRSVERRIKEGHLQLSSTQYLECRSSNLMLARLVTHLIIENQLPVSPLENCRQGIQMEWERAQRTSTTDSSTMPLYYSIRAYKERLNREPQWISTAASDDTLFRQIGELMEARNLDRGRQIRNIIEDLRNQFRDVKDASTNPAVVAAKETARTEWKKALLAFALGVITACVTLVGVILANWDKTPWGRKHPQAPCIVAPPNPAATGSTKR